MFREIKISLKFILLTCIVLTSCARLSPSTLKNVTKVLTGQKTGSDDGAFGKPTAEVKNVTKLKKTPTDKAKTIETLPKGASLSVMQDVKDGWTQVGVARQGVPIIGFVKTKDILSANSKGKFSGGNGQFSFSKEPIQAGYSLSFASNKTQIEQGQLDKVLNNLSGLDLVYANRQDDKISKLGVLGFLERGMIRLGSVETDKATEDFRTVEKILEERENSSIVGSTLSSYADSVAEAVSGHDDINDYAGEDYELIFALNLASLAYALDGDRSSYNVARRAIDKQMQAEVAYKEREIEINKDLAKANSKAQSNSAFSFSTFSAELDKYYDQHTSKVASRVKSTYINPLGYLMTGIVQEIDSSSDGSLKSNALISYQKALQLSPNSKQLSQAVKDLTSESFSPEGILYVIVGSGYAPERRVVEANSPYILGNIPLKFALALPQSDSVSKVTIAVNGKSYSLEEVSDNEAIVMRSERDRLSEQKLLIGSSVVKKMGLDSALLALNLRTETRGLYSLLSSQRYTFDMSGTPDTRSWLTLPRRFLFARIKVGAGTKSAVLTSQDSKGRTLASSKLDLNISPMAIIYARSAGKSLYSKSNSKLWLKN